MVFGGNDIFVGIIRPTPVMRHCVAEKLLLDTEVVCAVSHTPILAVERELQAARCRNLYSSQLVCECFTISFLEIIRQKEIPVAVIIEIQITHLVLLGLPWKCYRKW